MSETILEIWTVSRNLILLNCSVYFRCNNNGIVFNKKRILYLLGKGVDSRAGAGKKIQDERRTSCGSRKEGSA